MFFSIKKDSRIRGDEVSLVRDRCRLDIRKYSFLRRTINEWNNLSTDCVNVSSMNIDQINQEGRSYIDTKLLDSR